MKSDGCARKGFLDQNRTESGFTLLELLVVVFIITLISGFAVLSLRGVDLDQHMRQEVERAAQLFDLASKEAVVQGRPIGIFLAPQSYSFLFAGVDAWEEEEIGTFRPRGIPYDWRMEWEGIESDSSFSSQEDGEPAEKSPHVIFYPTGEADPLELIWRNSEGEAKYRLIVSPVGQVEFLSAEDIL